jgi:hypothetical protein
LAAGVLAAGLLAATPSATADDGTTTSTTTTAPPPPPTTTTTTTTPTTPTVPRPTTIAAGVTIAGELLVGGLSPAQATTAVKSYFARPLSLQLGRTTLKITPKQLGAAAFVGDAVKRARITAPGGNVPLKVSAPKARLERYVATLAKRFDRVPVDATLRLKGSKPFVTKDRPGLRVRQVFAVRDLFRSLKSHARDRTGSTSTTG